MTTSGDSKSTSRLQLLGLFVIWAVVLGGLFLFMRWHSDRIAEDVRRLYEQEARDHENRVRGRHRGRRHVRRRRVLADLDTSDQDCKHAGADAMTEEKQCKGETWDGHRSARCWFRARPNSDYCGHHDPKKQAAKKAKRGPTKAARELFAGKAIRKLLDVLKEHGDPMVVHAANAISDLLPSYGWGADLPEWALAEFKTEER